MARNLANVEWHPRIDRRHPEIFILYLAVAVLITSPLAALKSTLGLSVYGVIGLALVIAAPLAFCALVVNLWVHRTHRNWWWAWIAGCTMHLPMRLLPPTANMTIPFQYAPVDNEAFEWLKSLPPWTYTIGYERVTFLYRRDAMFYKLAYT